MRKYFGLIVLLLSTGTALAGTITSDIFSGNKFSGSATSVFSGKTATFDNISGNFHGNVFGNLSGNVNATVVVADSIISGTVTTDSVFSKNPVADIRAYGAIADDGIDDTDKIQDAIDDLPAGGVLYIPRGTWDISATLNMSAEYQTVRGDGWESILKQASTAAGKGGIKTTFDGLFVKDLQIQSPTQVGNENIAIAAAKDDTSAIADIRVDNCFLTGFSYGVSITNATRPVIEKNYIYSTGDNSTDSGGALQLSQVIDGVIDRNIISGDPANRFQHGMYLAGDIDGLVVTNNIIRSGFYSYGIHIYGSTFTNNRKNIEISGNQITEVIGGILVGRATATTGDISYLTISNNNIQVTQRGLYFEVGDLSHVRITDNLIQSGGSAIIPNYIFSITQSAGETASDIQVSGNTFKNFRNGGLDINNAQSISGLVIDRNTFVPDAGGLAAIAMDSASATGYDGLQITNNISAGAYDVIFSTANYSDLKQVTWLAMYGNSWDIGFSNKVTRVSTTPYTLVNNDELIWVTTGATDVTINLPTVVGGTALDGRLITVCKIDAGAGTVIIDPDSTQLINGASTYTLSARWQTATFRLVNGSGWILVGKN